MPTTTPRKTICAALFLALCGCVTAAHAAKTCDALSAEIAAKLDAKGIKGYELAVLGKDQATDAKVVGTCEGGSKKITYAKK